MRLGQLARGQRSHRLGCPALACSFTRSRRTCHYPCWLAGWRVLGFALDPPVSQRTGREAHAIRAARAIGFRDHLRVRVEVGMAGGHDDVLGLHAQAMRSRRSFAEVKVRPAGGAPEHPTGRQTCATERSKAVPPRADVPGECPAIARSMSIQPRSQKSRGSHKAESARIANAAARFGLRSRPGTPIARSTGTQRHLKELAASASHGVAEGRRCGRPAAAPRNRSEKRMSLGGQC